MNILVLIFVAVSSTAMFYVKNPTYAPVCGQNGITYNNTNDLKDSFVRKKYDGVCQNAEQLQLTCDDHEAIVCGADGVTYKNSCFTGDVAVIHNGACEVPQNNKNDDGNGFIKIK